MAFAGHNHVELDNINMEAKNLNDFKKSFVLSININFRYFIIFFFVFLFCNIHGQFEINITIKGTGNQNIINSGFYLDPSEILVEGGKTFL